MAEHLNGTHFEACVLLKNSTSAASSRIKQRQQLSTDIHLLTVMFARLSSASLYALLALTAFVTTSCASTSETDFA
jgi:hypothetical protein